MHDFHIAPENKAPPPTPFGVLFKRGFFSSGIMPVYFDKERHVFEGFCALDFCEDTGWERKRVMVCAKEENRLNQEKRRRKRK